MAAQSNKAVSVLIIVPAWNEAESIGETLAELLRFSQDFDVLVVDDGSTDSTQSLARAAGVSVCSLPFNLGVGGAMRAGYRFASRNNYDVAVQFDADGQHDPQYIESLISELCDTGSNIVIGARFAGKGDYRVGVLRSIAMKMLAVCVGGLTRSKLTDATSGFRAIDREALKVFERHYPAEYLGDTVESLVIASRHGCRISQIPVEMSPRRMGKASQSSLRSIVFLARAFAALFLAVVRNWSKPVRSERTDLRHSLGDASVLRTEKS